LLSRASCIGIRGAPHQQPRRVRPYKNETETRYYTESARTRTRNNTNPKGTEANAGTGPIKMKPKPGIKNNKPYTAAPQLRVISSLAASWKPVSPPKRISGLVTRILKAPAASAGPADSRTDLRFLVTSPRGSYRSAILECPSSWGFSSRPLLSTHPN
jgi:hypothetical protein